MCFMIFIVPEKLHSPGRGRGLFCLLLLGHDPLIVVLRLGFTPWTKDEREQGRWGRLACSGDVRGTASPGHMLSTLKSVCCFHGHSTLEVIQSASHCAFVLSLEQKGKTFWKLPAKKFSRLVSLFGTLVGCTEWLEKLWMESAISGMSMNQ